MQIAKASRGRAWVILGATLLVLAASACGGGDDNASEDAQASTTAQASVDPADCSAQVTNSYVPLASVKLKVFRGNEPGDEGGEQVQTRAEQRVQPKPVTIAGFPVRVVEVTETENGELVERTLDYYSQCGDGSVWYVGEKVDNYEEGKIVDHEGEWLAGENGASAGLFMPAEPRVGDDFQQESAPGVAEDRSTVVADDVKVTSPAGRFSGCIRTKDVAPIDHITEFKLYCPDVGLVREELTDGRLELLRYS
jgi:hypothetical protein